MQMNKKNNEQLINNMIGQLNGINRMLVSKKDCKSVIIQMKAVRSAMESLMNKYISENIGSCLGAKGESKDKEKLKELIKEIIKT